VPLSVGGELGPHLTQCSRLVAIYTNVTDSQKGQTDRQRSSSIGRTVFSERDAVARPSVVCRLCVTLVHPTRTVEIFGIFSTPFGTLAIR